MAMDDDFRDSVWKIRFGCPVSCCQFCIRRGSHERINPVPECAERVQHLDMSKIGRGIDIRMDKRQTFQRRRSFAEQDFALITDNPGNDCVWGMTAGLCKRSPSSAR